MIKTPAISPSFLLSLQFFLQKEAPVLPEEESSMWASVMKNYQYSVWHQDLMSQGFFLEKWKTPISSTSPHLTWAHEETLWLSGEVSIHEKDFKAFTPRRLIIEWQEPHAEQIWLSLLIAKKQGCECWIHGPWSNTEEWFQRWHLANDIGVSWAFNNTALSESQWDEVLDVWMHPEWSIQRVWPLNEWSVRALQRLWQRSVEKDTPPYPWKKERHARIDEQHFENAFLKWASKDEMEKLLVSVSHFLKTPRPT